MTEQKTASDAVTIVVRYTPTVAGVDDPEIARRCGATR